MAGLSALFQGKFSDFVSGEIYLQSPRKYKYSTGPVSLLLVTSRMTIYAFSSKSF